MELLSQAQAEPAPRRDDMKPEKLAFAMWNEEEGRWQTVLCPQEAVIMIPWENLQIDKTPPHGCQGRRNLEHQLRF